MTNPILMLARNNPELSRRAINSALMQDIYTSAFVIDNGSEIPFANSLTWVRHISYNMGVTLGWNIGLTFLFDQMQSEHVLVINNDIELPSWGYRMLLSYGAPLVSGVAVNSMAAIASIPTAMPLAPHPDFSCFLIRRECWRKVGAFDASMKLYASDCDYHVRAHRAGVQLAKANIPFFHHGSSTLKTATPAEQVEINKQANLDRETFRRIYGCIPGEAAYTELFK